MQQNMPSFEVRKHCHRPEALYQILIRFISIAPAQDNGSESSRFARKIGVPEFDRNVFIARKVNMT